MVLLLSGADVAALVDMKEAIQALEDAYREFQLGRSVVPTRIMMSVPGHHGRLAAMPAYLSGFDVLATKIVTGYEHNHQMDIPYIHALIVLNDPRTGQTIAILDGTYITALRTAAASGVATAYLANKDARVLGIVGAGVQARSHLWAMIQVRSIEKVRVYGSSEESMQRFKEEMQERFDVGIEPCSSPRAVVEGSDVVVTATRCKTPIVSTSWLAPGTHINIIDCHNALDSTELDDAKLVVDSKDAFLHAMTVEKGRSLSEDIYAEIGEIVAGTKEARTGASEITIYKSVGTGIQDAAIAGLVYRRAIKSGIGTRAEI